MQHDIIARLAFTLSARLWMNLLCAFATGAGTRAS